MVTLCFTQSVAKNKQQQTTKKGLETAGGAIQELIDVSNMGQSVLRKVCHN